MTTGTLDGISQAIGGLQSDMRNVTATLDRVFAFIKESNAAMAENLENHITDDAKAHKNLIDDIEDLKSFRNRIYGIAAVIGVGASFMSQFIGNAIKKLFI